jgi:hypothetical protein
MENERFLTRQFEWRSLGYDMRLCCLHVKSAKHRLALVEVGASQKASEPQLRAPDSRKAEVCVQRAGCLDMHMIRERASARVGYGWSKERGSAYGKE